MEQGRPIVTNARPVGALLVILGAALLGDPAHAGRPMATDDAATVGARTCQVETWVEASRTSTADGRVHGRDMVVSPACGIGEAVELNVELMRSRPTDGVRLRSALAIKWVDPAWESEGLRWGLKFWHGTAHLETPSSSQAEGTGASGLLSWQASPALTVHANLGVERDHLSRRTHGLASAALDWAVTDRLHWFAEALKLQRQPAQFNTGLRWWLIPERLAFDVTAGRSPGVEPQRRLGIGLGWYGLEW